MLRAVELFAGERELGVAKLELHHYVLGDRGLIGDAQVLGREDDAVQLHEISTVHCLSE